MRHISLDESFWRSVPEALESGEFPTDVESCLLDVSSLLLRIEESATLRPGGRLGVFTLGGGEEERALGLALAALLARRGRKILLVDLNGADTWRRLLGSEEPSGFAEHASRAASPALPVQTTSWSGLSLLFGGAALAEHPGIFGSGELGRQLDLLSADHDLVIVGLPFHVTLDWSPDILSRLDWAILTGTAGDEFAFELALPKLMQRIDLLATLDVPPLGRWRTGLAAALPALLRDSHRERTAPAYEAEASPVSGAATGTPISTVPHEPSAPREFPDPETAADVAFLSGLVETALSVHPKLRPYVQARLDFDPPPAAPPAPGPELRELASEWPGPEEGTIADLAGLAAVKEEDSGGRGGMTALALLLCLLLGAGAFWYWHANQQIPEGQFTFVESEPAAALEGQPGALGALKEQEPERTGPAAGSAAGDEAPALAGVDDGAPGRPSSGARGAAAREEEPVDREEEAPRRSEGAPAADEAAAAPEARETAEIPPGEGPGPDAEEAPPRREEAGPPESGPVLGFSLHVGSYQTYEAAERAAGALRGRGQQAFIVPVLLEEKGQWYRVFVGALEDRAESRAALARARGEGAIGEGAVRETPWALYLGTYETREEAREVVARLARSGISAYALGSGPLILYAGAFESASDAEILNRQLRDRGFDAALVRRRGAESQ